MELLVVLLVISVLAYVLSERRNGSSVGGETTSARDHAEPIKPKPYFGDELVDSLLRFAWHNLAYIESAELRKEIWPIALFAQMKGFRAAQKDIEDFVSSHSEEEIRQFWTVLHPILQAQARMDDLAWESYQELKERGP